MKGGASLLVLFEGGEDVAQAAQGSGALLTSAYFSSSR